MNNKDLTLYKEGFEPVTAISNSIVEGLFIGIYLYNVTAEDFLKTVTPCGVIVCPCGISVEYNGLPETDTKHPCGNKNHWTVKYKSKAHDQLADSSA